MKRIRPCRTSGIVVAILLLALAPAAPATLAVRAASNAPSRPASAEPTPTSAPLLAGEPLGFEVNRGQTNEEVRFLARGKQGTVFLTSREAIVAFGGGDSKRAAVHLAAVGAAAAPTIEGLDRLPCVSNYFIGNDPSRWRTNVARYARVRYKDVYPGIDMVFHGGPNGIEYDFVLAPGADPRRISLDVRGADALSVGDDGALVATTCAGELRQEPPRIYQEVDGTRREVDGGFAFGRDGRFGFRIGAYDPGQRLVVDPTIGYKLRFGGTGDDSVAGIAVDAAGDAYVTGTTSSSDFPTANPLDGTLSGAQDAYVAKVKPDGTGLAYATYLGGSDIDSAAGIAVDAHGDAYVLGSTKSADFPVTAGAAQTVYAGMQDGFVARINAAGNALVYSTYLGGSNIEFAFGIGLDRGGRAYAVGTTLSSNFPTHNAYKPMGPSPGETDGFLAVVNAAGTALDYSTCFGGHGFDDCLAVAVDLGGMAYVTGDTLSSGGDFPTTPGAISGTSGGADDTFAAKFDPAMSGMASLVYSTFLGGGLVDIGFGIAVDGAGNAYVTGLTQSNDLPRTPNAFQATYNGGNSDAFLQEVSTDGSTLVYGSYLGGTADDVGQGIAVGADGRVLVVGHTGSPNFPQASAVQAAYGGGAADAFLTSLPTTGGPPDFSTYLGGSNFEFGNAVAFGPTGTDAYVGITSNSLDFPSAAGKESDPHLAGSADEANIVVVGGFDPFLRADVAVNDYATDTLLLDNISTTFFAGAGEVMVTKGCAVENNGPDPAVEVVLCLLLPPELEFSDLFVVAGSGLVSSVEKPAKGAKGGLVKLHIPVLQPDEVVVFTCTLHGSDVFADLRPSFKTIAQSKTPDPKPANNTEDEQIFIFGDPAAKEDRLKWANLVDETLNPSPGHLTLTTAAPEAMKPSAELDRASANRAASPDSQITAYTVYSSTQPHVQPSPNNVFAMVPPTQTDADVTTAPPGSYFVVTASYADGSESAPSNEVGGPLPTITGLQVSDAKIVVKGSGFAATTAVSLDGVPFTVKAKAKTGTKVVQKGKLVTNQTVGEYLTAHGGSTDIIITDGHGNFSSIRYVR